MVKMYKYKPEFLTKKLEGAKLKLVSDNYPKLFEKAKTKSGFKSKISMELLNSFIVYLGKKSRHFDGIPAEFLNTTD